MPGVTVTAHVELEGQVSLRERDAPVHVVAAATAFTPKKVMISVGVPDSYYEEIWRKSHPTLDGRAPVKPGNKALEQIERTEKRKIQEFVSQSIPQPDVTADVRPLVTVTTFAQLPAADVPTPATTETALAWLSSHRSALGAISLMSVSLFLLRSMVRSRQVSGPASALQSSSCAGKENRANRPRRTCPPCPQIETLTTDIRRKRRGAISGREELRRWFAMTPRVAAKILRRPGSAVRVRVAQSASPKSHKPDAHNAR